MDDLGGKARTRKRWATRLVAGALVASIGVVVAIYVRRNFRLPKQRAGVPPLPENIQRRLSVFNLTRSNGGQRVFTIHADRTLAYKTGGETALSNVTVEFFGRRGERRDILRTRQATYYRTSGNFSARTQVQLELNSHLGTPPGGKNAGGSTSEGSSSSLSSQPPFFLETSGVTYDYEKALLVTAEPVTFRAGPLSGAAVGMLYATRDGQLELDKDVKATLSLQKAMAGDGPVHLIASRLRFDKDAHQAELWGPIALRQGDRTGSASHAWIALNEANRVTQVKLDGAANFRQSSPTGETHLLCDQVAGTLDPRSEEIETLDAEGHVRGDFARQGRRGSLEADELRLLFARQKPESGRASGNVHVSIVSHPPAQRAPLESAAAAFGSHEELTTNQLDFRFLPGGTALKSASTPSAGKLVLYPQDAKEGLRTVTAGRFVFGFDSMGQLTTLGGSGGTRVESAPAAESRKQSPPAVTTANELLARLDPGAETLRSLVQSGNFQYQQADDQARAEKAVYSASNDSLVLTGHPEAWNATTQTQAHRVVMGLTSGETEGVGDVRVTRRDAASPSGLPTNILADRATANRHTETAHYSGNVRAWHGPDVIETSALNIDRLKQTVRGGPPVVSSYSVSAEQNTGKIDAGSAKAASEPLTIRADGLEYSVSERKAIYRGKVALRTQNTIMQADRLEVFFADSSSNEGLQVQRAVAEGNVLVTQPGRRTTGNRADYDARQGKIVMTGGPPKIYDAERGLTTGRRLTFFTLDDRLIVDSGSNSTNPTIRNVAQ